MTRQATSCILWPLATGLTWAVIWDGWSQRGPENEQIPPRPNFKRSRTVNQAVRRHQATNATPHPSLLQPPLPLSVPEAAGSRNACNVTRRHISTLLWSSAASESVSLKLNAPSSTLHASWEVSRLGCLHIKMTEGFTVVTRNWSKQPPCMTTTCLAFHIFQSTGTLCFFCPGTTRAGQEITSLEKKKKEARNRKQ